MKVRSLEETLRRYVRNSTKAFLEGKKNLNWIVGILSHSGLSKKDTLAILLPFRNYGQPSRAQELFGWLESDAE